MRINLLTPLSDHTGYGLAGANLAVELSRMAEVNICAAGPSATFAKPIEAHRMLSRVRRAEQLDPSLPTIHLSDTEPVPSGDPLIIYTCFDTPRLPAARKRQYAQYDAVLGMSTWFTNVVRAEGINRAYAVVQGFDPAFFHPWPVPRRALEDRFVFFSGGKFEFRKAQDVVIAAFKVMQQRHADVHLVTAWHNPWPAIIQSMQLSTRLDFSGITSMDDVAQLMSRLGIDPDRVTMLGAISNPGMPYVYRQCDCGLFPNRTEPANNQVLTELMACGVPAIAGYHTGHLDVLRPNENCLALTEFTNIPACCDRTEGEDLGHWLEPEFDEVVDKMEYAYQNRDEVKQFGRQAADDMHATFTWTKVAGRILHALQEVMGMGPASAAVGSSLADQTEVLELTSN